MTTEKQVLRQASNKVTIWGTAQESTLEVKEFKDKVTQAPYNAISGKLTLKTGEDETQVVQYFEKELTKKGDLNKNFKSLTTAMEKMVTLADIAQGLAEGTPSNLVCQGELGLNEYRNQEGNVVSNVQINGKFSPQTYKDEAPFQFKAEFDIQGIVAKDAEYETDRDDNETGRIKIELLVPLYGGKIIPLSFVTATTLPQLGKDYITDNFTKNASINVYGNMVNINKKNVRIVEGGFGDSKEEVTYDRVREFVATGGSFYEEESKDVFDVSLLKEAKANRERYLSSLTASEKKPNAGGGAPAKQAGFGTAPSTSPQTAPTASDDDLGDLFED